MRFKFWSRLLYILVVSDIAIAEGINTTINKDSNAQWTATYLASRPIKRIAFVRNPDASRIQRWNAIEEDLEIILEDDQEYIVSKTGALFQSATLSLTPTYKHLSKDYAPFSPFSDGSTLIHSGRLFACENTCDDLLNEWKITLSAPRHDYIIVDGEVRQAKVSWIDRSDGKNIYVGPQKPIIEDNFISVIDEGLPQEIKTSLQADIPKMMSYLESKFGKLNSTQKPSLFASYAKVDGTSVQGGVLPNQIFIHWNRNNLEEQVGNERFINDLLWTFAHEAGHLYQQFGDLALETHNSWIHEGHAEMVAFDVLKHLYPKSQDFLEAKIGSFKQQCAAGLSETSLNNAAANGKFSLYYSCGFLIHQAIENAMKKTPGQEHSAYITWNRFRDKRNKEGAKEKVTFLKVVGESSNEELLDKIRVFLDLKKSNPTKEIEALLNS